LSILCRSFFGFLLFCLLQVLREDWRREKDGVWARPTRGKGGWAAGGKDIYKKRSGWVGPRPDPA